MFFKIITGACVQYSSTVVLQLPDLLYKTIKFLATEDIDKTVAHGLGTRWSFMGPFETIDLNAPKGVSDYAARLKFLYHDIAMSRDSPKEWSEKLIERVDTEMRMQLSLEDIKKKQRWRDRKLMELLAFKNKNIKGE